MKNSKVKEAQKATWVGFFVNFLLTIFKILAGVFGKSTAMLADGIHSLSDFITDIIVISFIGVSGRDRDYDHHYGHGKYETFATMLISLALFVVGAGIFWSGLSKVIEVAKGTPIPEPSMLALVAAIISIIFKESLYWYTKKVGQKINSQAVIANAWHHRSDSLSSIGVAMGISGAMFLGSHWHILDPIAGMIVSIFIVKIAIQLGMPSMHELLERSLPANIVQEIEDIIMEDEEIIDFHNLKTRKIGDVYAIDVHIKLNRKISFIHSHDLATNLEKRLRRKFGDSTITNIHTEPYKSI